MKRDKWMPSKYSVLCEKHFTSNDYHDANRTKRILKPDAVPSIFQFPSHLNKISKPRSTPAKRKAPSPAKTEAPENKSKRKAPSPVKIEVPEKKSKLQTNLGEHSYCVSPSKVIPKLRKSLEKRKKKIKVLTRKNLKEKNHQWFVKKAERYEALGCRADPKSSIQFWSHDKGLVY